MSDLLRSNARVRPEALAVWTPSGEWTYEELHRAVATAQIRLRDEGVEPGMRVALHLPRDFRAIVMLWALWRAGAVAMPISTRLPASEVGRRVHRGGGTFLVTDAPEVQRAVPDELTVLSFEGADGETDDLEAEAFSNQDRSRDRPATILFTSGSTGDPKPALHTWANHLYSAKGANANIPLRSGDRWLLSLPLYHVGGMAILVRCALVGAAVAVPSPEASLAASLGEMDVTHVSLVATQFRRLLAEVAGPPPPDLRAVLLGGGPIPETLLQRGNERGWPLHTSYGCTEMASQVTTTAPGAALDELQTAGRRLPHRRIKIDDGQILVAGKPLFRGYVTAEGIDDPREDGWYPTGDRGHIDAIGRLHVLGRMDRMFVSGGENIQPEEIEAALERVDAVDRAVVVPVSDPEYGHRPVAFVRSAEKVSDDVLENALKKTLPGFKIPDAFHSLPEECLTGPLKIDREALRKQARKLHEDRPDGEGD